MQVCNKILNLDTSDSTAFHCKVSSLLDQLTPPSSLLQIVSLMQAGKFPEALKQMETSKHQALPPSLGLP